MQIKRYNQKCRCLKLTNELLRDIVEPSWTLFTFYCVFLAYVVEFAFLVRWVPGTTVTMLVTWIVKCFLYVLSHYLFLYAVNAQSCPIQTFRKGKDWLEKSKHNFHAFIWNVLTL